MLILSGGQPIRLARVIGEAQRAVQDGLERLSLGARVRRAADDPAGLAVATRLSADAASRRAAIRNTEDALNAAEVADRGMQQVQALLSRMRELAVQAASETLDDTQRGYVQDELEMLLDELDATAEDAVYGEQSTLSNPGVDVGLLIDTSGSMFGEIVRVQESIADFQQRFVDARYNVKIGLAEYRNSADALDNVVRLAQPGSGELISELDALVPIGGATDPWAALTETAGVTRIIGETESDSFAFRSGSVRLQVLITDSKRQADYLDGASQADVADRLEAAEMQVHAITTPSVYGDYSTITDTTGGALYDIGNSSGSGIIDALDQIADAAIAQLDSNEPLTVHIDIDSDDFLQTPLPYDVTALNLSLAGVSVATAADARASLDSLDTAISTVSSGQSQVGALQLRLESTLRTHAARLEAETAAASAITDADMAAEAAALTAAQIRLQAATATVAAATGLDRASAEALLPG